MKKTTGKSTQSGSKKTNSGKAKATQSKVSRTGELRDLFKEELKDIYWAEKALTKAIPKMIKNASSDELIEVLTGHLEETGEHVKRLEEVFSSIGEKVQAKKCEAMDGLIREASEIMQSTEKGMVRDAAIILAGQKVEHYEIATYGTLCSFARTIGESKAEELLQDTLDEEKGADEKFSEIAKSFVNEEAAVH